MSRVVVLNVLRKPLLLPFFQSRVPAGFPSPAEDHMGVKLDLNALLLSHPHATYLVMVEGHSMTGGRSGIQDGALLAVDCRLKPRHDDIIIAVVEGQHTVKRLIQRGQDWWLVPDNPLYPSIPLTGEPDLYDCWGVVTHVVTETRPGRLSRYVRVS
ncbi:translesion error-prone DNA polymerase V autoproteolytic subunit [Hymenobacter cellulosivorans]|uniref:Translesion error-prone DNA polymerase V autoproteolytic subunit n=1 Tax=Hymenobacter cellulosivorans TaxID=2932249 RepID=A0ABY4FAJ0_9BACT|nr:translesion error-prone DNA polymerase V autoproteolytic subunit [Hymenobacter cellulosivorans]UOQ53028.1 translesion error-prone DNA polymerase V autoproteolytic subunit [Hymenobacter cellulosivorans]